MRIDEHPTPELIRSLKPDRPTDYSIRREDFETEFGIRVLPPTKRRRWYRRSWYIRYYVNGRGSERRRLDLGLCARVSFHKAVARAYAAWDRIAVGEDPQGDRLARRAKASQRSGKTFAEVRELYVERWARATKASWRRDELVLARCPKAWEKQAFRTLTREQVHAWLMTELERGNEVARQSRSIISRVFAWAKETGIRADHPAQAIKLPLPPAKRKQERAFSALEIGTLYHELSALEGKPATILLLTLLTGQRGGEVRKMTWEMIDDRPDIPGLDAAGCAWWDLPEEITKNRCPHRVCLMPAVLEILAPHRALAPRDPHGNPIGPVFPGRFPDRPMTEKPVGDLAREIRRCYPTWKHWDPTLTFRRTFISTMHRWNLPRYVIRAMVNHVSQGSEAVTDGYNYWWYPTERYEVLSRYLDFVLECARRVDGDQGRLLSEVDAEDLSSRLEV